jgi:ParB family chromosome partitioning protein
MSVRQTEELVKQLYRPSKKGTEKELKPQPQFQKIGDQMSSHFGTKIKVEHQQTGKGKIIMEYYSLEELNALLDKMNVSIH